MRTLLSQLDGLGGALSTVVAGTNTMTPSDVDAYIRAIQRKIKFALAHYRVLEGIKWREVENIGRSPDGQSPPQPLIVELNESELRIHHPGAVTDHVYLAFDGLTASVVNMTDTYGRLINGVYSLGLDVRYANLFEIQKKCLKTSSLGKILYDPTNTEWLSSLRKLRGRCQHADIEDAIAAQSGPYSCRNEPMISKDYSWKNPQLDAPIVSYAREAMSAVENTLGACILAVMASPQNPIK